MKQAQKSYKSFNTIKMYLGLNGQDYWHIDYPEYRQKYNGENYYWDMRKKAELYDGSFDQNGIPDFLGEDGVIYKNIFVIAHYGIGCYEKYLETKNADWLERFKKQVDWLIFNQQDYRSVSGCWPCLFPTQLYGLNDGFISGMAQGMAISMLTRAYKTFKEEKYLDAAIKAVIPLKLNVVEGGVFYEKDGMISIEEYPTIDNPSFVLNGYISALLGLNDLLDVYDSIEINGFYNLCINSLVKNIGFWDLPHWSKYDVYTWGTSNYSSYFYHKYHIKQMRVMYNLTGYEEFRRMGDKWGRDIKNPIFLMNALFRKILFRVNGRL